MFYYFFIPSLIISLSILLIFLSIKLKKRNQDNSKIEVKILKTLDNEIQNQNDTTNASSSISDEKYKQYKFKELIRKADELLINKVNIEYTLKAYKKALSIIPNDKYTISQIKKLEIKQYKKLITRDYSIKENQSNITNIDIFETSPQYLHPSFLYVEKIKKADNLFYNNVNYEFTIRAYEEALKIVPNDEYAICQINILKEKQLKKLTNKIKPNPKIIKEAVVSKVERLKVESPSYIEIETDYSNFIKSFEKISFYTIYEYSKHIIQSLDTTLKDYYKEELMNGTTIIESAELMHMYLFAYGKMHKAKLESAFKHIPNELLNKKFEIYDWACGQGIASITFIDFFGTRNISRFTLIEPSELSLKRAALNINTYFPNGNIKTICKTIDNLSHNDVSSSKNITKFHFFSNILDITDIDISKLISLIEETQKGENIFICVSPYVSDIKSEKVDNFKKHFEKTHHLSYKLICSLENTSNPNNPYWNCNNNYSGNFNGVYCQRMHPICGCEKKWTRMIRVFQVEI